MPLHVLSHHDGVVHHDAEGQDEPEQAEHVHGDPEPRHHQESAEERHRESGGGPDGEPAREREEEHQEDQGQALKPVPDQDVHAALEELPGIEPGGDGEPFRHGPFELADFGMYRLRGLEEPGAARQHHLEKRRGLPVHARRPLDVREAVGDDRHVSDRDHPAAGRGDQGDPGKVLAGDGFRLRADPQFAAVGPDGAARNVRGAPADRQRDLVERQPEAGEDVFRNLDRDLVVPPRGDVHRRHPGNGGERVPHPVRRLGETAFVGVPVDRDPQQQGVHPKLRDHRFFGIRRQRRQGLDPFPDLVADAPEVGPPFDLHGEDPDPLGREAGDLLHPRDVVERLLESHQDAVLDHLGAGAREDGGDGQGRGPRLGDHLLRDAAEGEQPAQRDPEQQEVGGHPVPDEPGDHAGLRTVARPGGGALHPGVHLRTTRRPGSPPAGLSSPR